MRQTLLLIAVMALVGCGTTKPTPPKAFTNTLGMVFKPVPGTEVSFCIWETRVKDYKAYAEVNKGWMATGRGP